MEDIAGDGPMDGAGVGGIAWIVQVRTNASCIVIFQSLSSRQGIIRLRRDVQPNNFQIHLGVLHSRAWKYLSNKPSAGATTLPSPLPLLLYHRIRSARVVNQRLGHIPRE